MDTRWRASNKFQGFLIVSDLRSCTMLSTLPLFYIAQSVNSEDRRVRFQGFSATAVFIRLNWIWRVKPSRASAVLHSSYSRASLIRQSHDVWNRPQRLKLSASWNSHRCPPQPHQQPFSPRPRLDCFLSNSHSKTGWEHILGLKQGKKNPSLPILLRCVGACIFENIACMFQKSLF